MKPGTFVGSRGPIIGGAAGTQQDQCTIDGNLLNWFLHQTGAGATEVNIEFNLATPVRTVYYVGNKGNPGGICFLSLQQIDPSINVGGVLVANGGEQWFQLETVENIPMTPIVCGVTFANPISKFYITHPDFGVGTIMKFLATDDVINFVGHQSC